MNRVIHFEIQASEPERAAKFYREVFGWEVRKYEGPGLEMEYWIVMTAPEESKEPGINGGMVRRPAAPPAPEQGTNAFVCTVAVENFDQMAEKIGLAGGVVALPKFPIPGLAWQGYFLDTEGNTFGIHQPDKNAQ